RQVVDELVDRPDLLRPRARRPRDAGPLVDATLSTHDLADPDQLARDLLVALDERVERGRHLGERALGAQPDSEVAVSRGLKGRHEAVELRLGQRAGAVR